MDTRKEHGQYWPGTRTATGGETPAGTDNGKVDRVDLGTLPADATASEMRTAIRNIQNAMRPLATALAAALCGFAMAQTAAWDSLRGGAHVVTNEQDSAAMATIATATNALHEEISAVSGQAASAAALATNGIPETLAGHETRIGALEESAADRPDMSLYALRAEVPQAVDLAPYATTTDVVNRISASASATALQIETLRQNTATAIVSSTNGLPEKIAAATNGIPVRIAAATNGLPERIASSTNEMYTSLAPTISAAATALQPTATNSIPETLAWHASELARLSLALAANTESNTAYRLMSPEGDIYQDATGAVWHVAYATNLSPWFVSGIAYTNGTAVATNVIPGVSSWSISGPYEYSEGSGSYYYNLHIPSGGNVYAQNNNTFDEQPLTLQFDIDTDVATANFTRTNIVTRYWIPADKVVYESTVPTPGNYAAVSNAAMSAVQPGELPTNMTTNDVCAIVTNVTEASWSWTYTGLPSGAVVTAPPYFTEGQGGELGWWTFTFTSEDHEHYWIGTILLEEYQENATVLPFDCYRDDGILEEVTATRTLSPSKNSLGIAGEKGAVSEILMIGSDKKLYHLRIGSGGSIDVYTEAE